jgi:hypothetical protein
MKDETVGAGDSPLDDFDLDSFLKENNFLPEEDKRRAIEGNAKQAGKRPVRRAASRRPASEKTGELNKTGEMDGADTTEKTSRTRGSKAGTTTARAKVGETDSDSTASSRTKGSRSGSGTTSTRATSTRTASTRTTSARAESTRTVPADTEPTRATSARMDPVDTEPTRTESTRTASTRAVSSRAKDTKKDDLNATMTYEALGEDYPEIPSVEIVDLEPHSEKDARKSARKARSGLASSSTTRSSFSADSTELALTETDFAEAVSAADILSGKAASSASSTFSTSSVSPASSEFFASSTSSARSGSTSSARPAAGSSVASLATALPTPIANRSRAAEAPATGRVGAEQTRPSTSLANPQDFQQAHYTDSGYRIRGGGTRHYRINPLLLALIAVVIIAGVGLSAFFFRNVFETLMVEKPDENVVTLTPAETRTAIDEEMPRMLDFVYYTVESAYAVLVDYGWNVSVDDRSGSDNADASAVESGIIHLAPTVDSAILNNGYYGGRFNAYSFDELQRSFNGAWIFDISQGDLGVFLQLEYVNFAALSLVDELEHLRAAQGLAGDDSVLDSQGTDDYGNSYIRGYIVIEETTYYWELIGISFGEYYRGQDKRDLPETSVFVKCKIADYSFYEMSGTPIGSGSGTSTEGGGDETETPSDDEGETEE